MTSGFQARDEGLALVGENSGPQWRAAFDAATRFLPAGWEGTGEDVRDNATKMGVPPAHHPNAYGARIMALIRRGVLLRTGRFRHMKKTSSHARLTPIYERT